MKDIFTAFPRSKYFGLEKLNTWDLYLPKKLLSLTTVDTFRVTALPFQPKWSTPVRGLQFWKLNCIGSFFFFFSVSCITANQKIVCLLLKSPLVESTRSPVKLFDGYPTHVDIRDFWVQQQTPQKSKDFWLKMGAIRWSIFLERPLNTSVTQNTSSWMIHEMEVLRSYRIPFWNFSSLPSPCLGMTDISLS